MPHEKAQGAAFLFNIPKHSRLGAVALAIAIGVTYFLAAWLGLALRAQVGVAIFWPAAGIAVGALIAFGPTSRLPAAVAVLLATIASSLTIGRTVWLGIAFGVVNAGQALTVSWLIERWFGRPFKLEDVPQVLGFLVASALGAATGASGATVAVGLVGPTAFPPHVWRIWFAACLLGTVTVAPLLIGIGDAAHRQPTRREFIEGGVGVLALSILSIFLISLPEGPWESALPVALVFPFLLWVTVRCQPVFAAAAVFVVALVIVWSAVFNAGHFGDASIPLESRILAAQTHVLAGALLALVLAALFADRRRSEAALKQSKERLQLALDGAELGAFSVDFATGRFECDARTAQSHGHDMPPMTMKESRRFVHPEDLVRIDAALAEAKCTGGIWNAEYRVVPPPNHLHAGETRWIATESSIVRNLQGTPEGLLGVTRDITHHKEAEQALAERDAQLSLAGKIARVGSFTFDFVSGAMQVSSGYAAIHGLPEGTTEITRAEWRARVHPDDLPRLDAHLQRDTDAGRSERGNCEYRIIRSVGDTRWIEARSFISYDHEGAAVRLTGTNIDITERKLAELALAERNLQFALAGRASLVGSYAYDTDTEILQVSEGYAVVHGFPEGTTRIARSEWLSGVHPEDVELLERCRSQAFRQRQVEYSVDYRILLPGRLVRWIEARCFISYHGDGHPQRVIGVIIDVTKRRQVENALTDRNKQLEIAGKVALVGSFAIEVDSAREDVTLQSMQVSPGFAAIYGLSENIAEITVGDWRSRIHPDDLPQFLASRYQAFAEQRAEHQAEYRIVRSSGVIRWVETRSSIEYHQDGHARRLVGVNIDITERKQAEEHRNILNAELDHRVKNALATVTAVISHTRQGSRSVADFAAALEGRIRSMATTHELLSSRHWQELSLIELIRRELAPYAASKNTEISGPTVLLKPEAGQALAMVLHELATNAAKYGALSTNKGRVLIRWDRRLNGRPLSGLVLEWQEVGGPRVDAPVKASYGTSTIHDLIPYEFGGTVDLVFAPEGIRCRLELPPDCLTDMGEPTEAVADTAG